MGLLHFYDTYQLVTDVKNMKGSRSLQTNISTQDESSNGIFEILNNIYLGADYEIDYETLKLRIRELAFLNKGLSITLRDDRDDEDTQGDIFLYEGGISEYVRFINQEKTTVHNDIIHLEGSPKIS